MAVKVIRICDTCRAEMEQDLDGIPVLEVWQQFTCANCIASGVKPQLWVARDDEAQGLVVIASQRYCALGPSATLVVHTDEQRHFAEGARKTQRRGAKMEIMQLRSTEQKQLLPAGTFIYIRE